MAKKTQAQLLALAQTIKNETAKKANTAIRVGGTLEDIVNINPLSYGGQFSFPDSELPLSERAGTLYKATADYGIFGEAEYIPSGSLFISNRDNATLFEHYDILI